MIISEEIEVVISSKNIHHYESLGYENLKMNQKLMVPIEYLAKGSHLEVDVQCDVCSKIKKLKYYAYNLNISNGGYYACCRICSLKKVKNTSLKKYGDENYNNRKKCKETTLKNYGVEYVFLLENFKNESKQTRLEKYGDENYNNIEKNKKTCLEKYGVEYTFQSEVVIKKCRKTRLEKYGDENYKNDEKIKKTNLEKYNVEFIFQSEEIKNKIIKTNLEKYGESSYTKTEECKEKIKKTNLEKYNVKCTFQNEEIKNKIKQTCLERYGVCSPMQNTDFFMKQQKSGYRIHFHENTKLNYRGTYEKHFLDYCFDNNISIEQGKRIKYLYEEVEHYYFSDYYIKSKNLVVEIKSSWTYNKYLSKNLVKQKTTIDYGYNYMIIKDKNYEEFEEYLNKT